MNGLRKKCENGNFSKKKRLEHFFALTGPNCKDSEKSNERFARNCVTNEGRTNGRYSLGLQRLCRETKNVRF